MPKCACAIVGNNCDQHIKFCSLHAAAGELLGAAQSTVVILETYASDATGGMVDKLKAAIKKARVSH